jgi:hypothetical protein
VIAPTVDLHAEVAERRLNRPALQAWARASIFACGNVVREIWVLSCAIRRSNLSTGFIYDISRGELISRRSP